MDVKEHAVFCMKKGGTALIISVLLDKGAFLFV
jgi:hypothetical protein